MAKINEKQFNSTINSIKKNGENLANAIHIAGLFAVTQANEHGNIGFGVRLIEAMGKKHDAQRVVNWLVRFGKFGVSKGELVYRQRKDITPANMDAAYEKAEACPYWELTPQKKLVESVDYLAMLQSIIKRHETVQKKINGGENITENNIGVLQAVNELLVKFTPAKTVNTAMTTL